MRFERKIEFYDSTPIEFKVIVELLEKSYVKTLQFIQEALRANRLQPRGSFYNDLIESFRGSKWQKKSSLLSQKNKFVNDISRIEFLPYSESLVLNEIFDKINDDTIYNLKLVVRQARIRHRVYKDLIRSMEEFKVRLAEERSSLKEEEKEKEILSLSLSDPLLNRFERKYKGSPPHSKGLDGRTEKCMICWKPINPTDLVMKCPHCSQKGHQDHILRWLVRRKYCPYCRTPWSGREQLIKGYQTDLATDKVLVNDITRLWSGKYPRISKYDEKLTRDIDYLIQRICQKSTTTPQSFPVSVELQGLITKAGELSKNLKINEAIRVLNDAHDIGVQVTAVESLVDIHNLLALLHHLRNNNTLSRNSLNFARTLATKINYSQGIEENEETQKCFVSTSFLERIEISYEKLTKIREMDLNQINDDIDHFHNEFNHPSMKSASTFIGPQKRRELYSDLIMIYSSFHEIKKLKPLTIPEIKRLETLKHQYEFTGEELRFILTKTKESLIERISPFKKKEKSQLKSLQPIIVFNARGVSLIEPESGEIIAIFPWIGFKIENKENKLVLEIGLCFILILSTISLRIWGLIRKMEIRYLNDIIKSYRMPGKMLRKDFDKDHLREIILRISSGGFPDYSTYNEAQKLLTVENPVIGT